MITINSEFVKEYMGIRPKDGHKGTFGKLLILAGSKGMVGAACLTAESALKSGAGLVKVGIDKDLMNVVNSNIIEATCIDPSNINFAEYTAMAIGPGFSVTEKSKDLLVSALSKFKGPMVIDADGLNIVSLYGLKNKIREYEYPLIFTPHIGEASRLIGEDANEMGRKELVKRISQKYQVITLLKGENTLVTQPNGEIYVNNLGNPGMATAGSGDCLTGIIVALIGKKQINTSDFQNDKFNNALRGTLAATYIHSYAGDLAAAEVGMVGMTAKDIVKYLPRAFKNILNY